MTTKLNTPAFAAAVGLMLTLGAIATPAVAKAPTPDEVVAMLTELRAELEWPGLTVEAAAKTLKTPAEALRFVREEIALVNYRGSYASPDAVLRTRVANATDKSYLLAILLTKMNVRVQLARANWPKGATPHQGAGPKRALPAMKKLDALLPTGKGKPPAALTGTQIKALADEVNASAKAVAKRLGDRLKGTPAAKDVEATRTDIDWVWVQAQLDGKTITDMDPTFPKLPRPKNVYAPFNPKPVTVGVRLEAVRAGQDKPTPILQWSGPTGVVLGYDMLITYYPADKDLKAAQTPEKVERWKPVLNCGPVQVLGQPFAPSGGPAKAVPAKPAPAPAPAPGGFGGLLGRRAKPKPAPAGDGRADSLRLVIEFNDPGGIRPWSATYSRTVQYVGAKYNPHELIATHRIAMGLAFVPPRVVEARMVDEVIGARRIRLIAEKGESAAAKVQRGISTRTANVLNSLLFTKLLATPNDLKLGWKGPAVVVETHQLRKLNGKLHFASRLDTLSESFGPLANQPRSRRMLWGLATGTIEARLLKGDSVNRLLLAAEKTLRLDPKAAGAIPKSVLAEGGAVLVSAGALGSAWALRPSGDLLVVYTDPRSGLAAKGADRMTPSEAGNLFGALGEGAMGTMGCPAGMLITPLVAYFNELAKAYGGATEVLIKLARTMETGDDRHMLNNRSDYFRNLGQRLTNALTRGFVRGWADAALGAGIGHALGTSGSLRPSDRLLDGLIAGGLSLPEEFVLFPSLLRRAMEAVTLPTD